VRFLGFVLQQRDEGRGVSVRLPSENVRRFRSRMREVQALYAAGALEPEEVVQRIRAWLAHASHGHTRALCIRELERIAFVRAVESQRDAERECQ